MNRARWIVGIVSVATLVAWVVSPVQATPITLALDLTATNKERCAPVPAMMGVPTVCTPLPPDPLEHGILVIDAPDPLPALFTATLLPLGSNYGGPPYDPTSTVLDFRAYPAFQMFCGGPPLQCLVGGRVTVQFPEGADAPILMAGAFIEARTSRGYRIEFGPGEAGPGGFEWTLGAPDPRSEFREAGTYTLTRIEDDNEREVPHPATLTLLALGLGLLARRGRSRRTAGTE